MQRVRAKRPWAETIVSALRDLGGEASLRDIYDQIEKAGGVDLGPSWKSCVRGALQVNCSQTLNFNRRSNLFYHKKQGVWGLVATNTVGD